MAFSYEVHAENYMIIHKSSFLFNGVSYERVQDIPLNDKAAMGVPFSIFVDNQSGAARLFSIIKTLESAGYLKKEMQVGTFETEEQLNKLLKITHKK